MAIIMKLILKYYFLSCLKAWELDLYNGKAYMSLGFMFKKIKLFNLPIPWFGNFEEIILRFVKENIKTWRCFINEKLILL
jgi:uncharacterized protein YqjF (DUF2071 family)